MDLSVTDAQRAVLEAQPSAGEETVLAAEAIGRVLARELSAMVDLPAWPVSVMDGYAVRADDLKRGPTFTVVDESAAGHPSTRPVAVGETVRISTGAVLPEGADAVIAQEDTARAGDTVTVDLEGAGDVRPGHFVRAAGSEVRRGDGLFAAGQIVGPGDAALAASAGHEMLLVRQRPRVAILCNGDELISPGTTPEPGQIVGTNDFMLAAQVREAGGEAVLLPAVGDDPAHLADALELGLSHDMLVTSGGISVGPHDLIASALADAGCERVFSKVALRPGRPITFATRAACSVFALPGNPASTFVTFELFVRPAIRRRLGTEEHRPTRVVTLGAAAPGMKSRQHYVRLRLEGDVAHPLGTQASGNPRSISNVHALLAVPAGVPQIEAGTAVEVHLLPRPWPA